MKFIDNSTKTNWKFVAIVVVFALLTVGGILLWRGVQEQPPTPQPQTQDTIPPQARKVFQTQHECEEQTEYQCQFVDCDIVDCAYDFEGEGWQSTDAKIEQEKIDTSPWQTYRNDEFGFEFQHPATYEVERNSPNPKVISLLGPNNSSIVIEIRSMEKSRDEYINDYIEAAGKARYGGKASLGVHRRLTVTVFDQPATQLEVSYLAIPAPAIETYIELTDGSLIRFVVAGWSDSQDFDSLRKVSDQILSTFRFVE